MHVQSCCFASGTYCFFLTFSLPSASLDLKVPILNLPRGLLHVSLISVQLPLFLESEYFAPHIDNTYYSLKIKYVPFLRSQPATIPCIRKAIKWARKLLIKKKGKGKRRAREKDRNRLAKKTSFGFCACVKNKKRLITSDQLNNVPFFLQNSFLAILMVISLTLVQ